MLKKIIKNNFKTKKDLFLFFVPIIFALILLIPVPYYFDLGGGVINIDENIYIEDEYSSDGEFYISYVSSVKGNVGFYLYSVLNDFVEKEYIDGNYVFDDDIEKTVNQYDLIKSKEDAKRVVFEYLDYDFDVSEEKLYISYISDKSNTNLNVGDDFVDFKSFDDLAEFVEKSKVGQTLKFNVERDSKIINAYAEVILMGNEKKIGIVTNDFIRYKSSINIKYYLDENIGGPSGGVIMALSIYNKLVEEDITKGYKIAGSGTIDEEGNVGEIGGIKFKLKGANNEGVDYFIVSDENYEEALKIVRKNNYDLKLISVESFEAAIYKLKKL